MSDFKGRKFSLINIAEKEIFCNGYIEVKDLKNVNEFIQILCLIPQNIKVKVIIEHLRYDDGTGLEDIDEETFNCLVDQFDDLVDEEKIDIEEDITFEINGFRDE